jgi:hypothetical protein
MKTRTGWIATVLVCALAAGACSKHDSPPPDPDAEEKPVELPDTPREAKLLPLPQAVAPASAPGAPRSALAWDVPRGGVEESPASAMRRAQYRVPGAAGEAECIVYYFGPGRGGDAASNAARWAGQFDQPDGRASAEVMRVTRLDGARIDVQLVEVTGTYDGGLTMTEAPAERREGYMLLGAIAQGADAPWFFKLTGPEATVRAQRESFVRMMESLRPGP